MNHIRRFALCEYIILIGFFDVKTVTFTLLTIIPIIVKSQALK